jgi:hypothetical protein
MIASAHLSSRPAVTALSVVAIAVLASGIWVLRTFDPGAAGNLFPSCLFHDITGWYCPGCGITRALHALVHFDLVRAFAMNALLVVSLPVLGFMALQGFTRRALLPTAVSRVVFNGRVWIGALLVFGIARNLPGLDIFAPGGLL